MTVSRTRTHTKIMFANPHLRCDGCGGPVPSWHDNLKCRCTENYWNNPCRHTAGITSACPSWNPVDGCTCPDSHTPGQPAPGPAT